MPVPSLSSRPLPPLTACTWHAPPLPGGPLHAGEVWGGGGGGRCGRWWRRGGGGGGEVVVEEVQTL